MNKVRIGIIGLGIGKWHLENFLKTEGAEVMALCDTDGERLNAIGREFKVPRLYSEVTSIINDRDIDAVSVCLPNFLHADITIAALEKGKNVLCEKPLADNITHARKIVSAARKTGKKCMVAMKFRFKPEAHYISRMGKNGELGEVYYGYTHYLRPPNGIPSGAGNWFISKKKAGGGALIDNGVHLLDLNWYLMGCPEPVHVFGSTYAKFGPEIEAIKDDFDVEDFGCGLIKFANGATIFLDNAWASMVNEEIIGLRVCGTKGGATMWPFSVFKPAGGTVKAETPDLANYCCQTQFEHFVGSIIHDYQPLAPAEHGLEILKMLDGIYRSQKIGAAVRLNG